MSVDPRAPMRDALIASLEAEGYLTDPRLEEAMLAVRREDFVPDDARDEALDDKPLPAGHGQTVSAPHMVSMMTGLLQLAPGEDVLEIGTGGGYHAAILQHMVGDGNVTSIECLEPLANRAKDNLTRAGLPVRVLHRDGALGAPEFAPFDAIIITCAVPDIPDALVEQLKPGGHFVAPVGHTQCRLRAGRKQDGRLVLFDHGPCLFVNAQGALGGADPSGLHPAP